MGISNEYFPLKSLPAVMKCLVVVLPFTNHEAVVYCNDDEFENLLEEKHCVKVHADIGTLVYNN